MNIKLTDDIKKLYNIFSEKERHAIRSFLRNSVSLPRFECSGNDFLADALINYESQPVYTVFEKGHYPLLFTIRSSVSLSEDDQFEFQGKSYIVIEIKNNTEIYVKELSRYVKVENALLD